MSAVNAGCPCDRHVWWLQRSNGQNRRILRSCATSSSVCWRLPRPLSPRNLPHPSSGPYFMVLHTLSAVCISSGQGTGHIPPPFHTSSAACMWQWSRHPSLLCLPVQGMPSTSSSQCHVAFLRCSLVHALHAYITLTAVLEGQ